MRSQNPTVAATLYLQALARRGQHTALALADQDGLLLAGTGPLDTEAVAAMAPLSQAGQSHAQALLQTIIRGGTLQIWPLELMGSRCYLAAVNGHSECPSDAEHALNRIFA